MVAKKQYGPLMCLPVVTRLYSTSLFVIGVGKHETLETKQAVWV